MTVDIEVNNVYCKVVTKLTIDQLAIVQQECQFKVEGSDFKANAFRSRRKGYEWDGYRKLFNIQTRRFPIGLLPRVRRLFESSGIGVNIINKRIVDYGYIECQPTLSHPLRDYQHSAILQSIINGNGIVKCATGGGKTVIAGRTISALRKKTIFIVHTRDLLYQTKKVFESIFGSNKIGQIGDGIIDYQDITVATMQTLAILGGVEIESNKYDEDGDNDEAKIEVDNDKFKQFHGYRTTVQCVMIDEVQIVSSQMVYGVRFLFEHANYAFGYSASPWRDDGSDLMIESAFGERIVDITASELIRNGYLVRPNIIIKKPNYQVTNGQGDYNAIYKRYIVENLPRNLQVANDAMEYYMKGMNTLILVTQIKHGDALQEAMTALGMPAVFISGKSSMKKRRQSIEDMRNGKIQLMIASTIADVGLDIPRLQCIVEAGAGKSSVTALQRLGRIMRIFDDKDECYFITYRDTAPHIKDHIDKKISIWRTESEFNIVEVV
jgi:superfamily II DNA or RNA helicase